MASPRALSTAMCVCGPNVLAGDPAVVAVIYDDDDHRVLLAVILEIALVARKLECSCK